MEKVKTLMKGIVKKNYSLDCIISMEAPTKELCDLTNEHEVKLKSFDSVKQLGSENLKEFAVGLALGFCSFLLWLFVKWKCL